MTAEDTVRESEGKMTCKNPKCSKDVPAKAYHFANALAVKIGFWSWVCMLHLGDAAWIKLKQGV
jgi:hypothetical protein